MMNTAMKLGFVFILLAVLTGAVFAQDAEEMGVGTPNPNVIGVDSAQQRLKEVSISKFEDAGFWEAAMSPDQGLIRMRRFEGGPQDKEPIPGEVETGVADQEADRFVLGLKVQVLRQRL